ncbi:MAG: hypothetical protein KKC51_04265 [Verrucomicrobia bacterium]|nr:hypothetical protein [Verrucomicrobiota bacterium]
MEKKMSKILILLCIVLMVCGCGKPRCDRETLNTVDLARILDVSWWKIDFNDKACSSVESITLGIYRSGTYSNIFTVATNMLSAEGGLQAVAALQRTDGGDIVASLSLFSANGSGTIGRRFIEKPFGGSGPTTIGSGMLTPRLGEKVLLAANGTALTFDRASTAFYLEFNAKANTGE